MFEIYDFLIYAFMAAPLARAFFPSSDPMVGLLSTFATFAVGFFMRPVGAIVIGSYGDRHGRRAALVMTIGLMAAGTGAIGLLPTYATLGVAAPIMLVLCRMAQGFSTGGEWGGAAAFLVEYAPSGKRGWISSFQQAATALGLLFATLVSYLLTTVLEPEAFSAWGWRLAFLLGFVLGPVGHYLRTHAHETPSFERAAGKREVVDSPLRVAFGAYRRPLLVGFGISICACAINYIFLVFFPSFAQQQLKIPASTTFLSTAISGIVYLVLSPLMGALSDRVGRRPVFLAASVLSGIGAYPLFLLVVSIPSAAGLILTQALASVLLSMFCGPLCAILSEQFPTRIRYSALSISYGLAVTIFGGLAPYFSAHLVQLTANPLAPALYVTLTAVLTFAATLFAQDRANLPLPEEGDRSADPFITEAR
ncbi:MFS transporter [Bradyrhizobium sp. BR 10289]|uniref:MFS transporter n=1 Tax=Bradyrhizobium sp. BR 10289 TaxID=2749993 RepID=UPI001C651075|nr:MFS transporter [Bradyrhizobium sp. BR 10289]MBW7970223.1 MFS transporter [Bradyrhizobium sp. BR 10289]